MAREITVHIWCDVCLEDDKREEGQSYTLSIGVGQAKNIELCGSHYAKLVEPIEFVLAAHGVPAEEDHQDVGPTKRRGEPKGKGVWPCPTCGQVYSYNSSMKEHHRTIHGVSLAKTAPHHEVGEFGCPECGKVENTRQRLGIHRRNAHGVQGETH